MPRTGQCAMNKHNERLESAGNTENINLVLIWRNMSKELFNKCVIAKLLGKNDRVVIRGAKVCTVCLAYVKDRFAEADEQDPNSSNDSSASGSGSGEEDGIREEVKNMIDLINGNELSVPEINALAKSFGGLLCIQIKDDISKLNQKYKDIEYLKNLTIENYIGGRPEGLINFLKSCVCSGRTTKAITKLQINNYLCKSIESIYGAHNTKFIAPYSALENLVMYYQTDSKMAVNIMSALSPGGTYPTIREIVNNMGKHPLQCPDDCDVIIAFDNNQVMKHDWRLKVDPVLPMSVITSICGLTSNTNYQMLVDFSPSNWPVVGNVINKFRQHLKMQSDLHSDYRKKFIEQRLDLLKASALTGQDTTKGRIGYNYERVLANQASVVKLFDIDPVLVNPNTEGSISQILQQLKEEFMAERNRKWIILVCDGSPFSIVQNLLRTTVICPHCLQDFHENNVFNHITAEHPEVPEEDMEFDFYEKSFKDFCLKPGNGHIEMNLLRSIFKLLWEPCLSKLADIVGFKTEKAKKYLLSNKDHHIAWQMIEALFITISDEILGRYLDIVRNGNMQGFFNWLSHNVRNATFKFYADILTSLLHPLMLYRAGIRCGNAEAALAGRDKAVYSFFLGNHPKYQHIILADLKQRMNFPEACPILNAESFSRRGSITSCEGADFILEARIKTIKGLLPPGVPTPNSWTKATRTAGIFEDIKDTQLTRMNIENKKFFKKDIDLQPVVARFKEAFQQSHILDNPEVVCENILTLGGKELHCSLKHFAAIGTQNLVNSFEGLINGTPVFQRMLFVQTTDAINKIEQFKVEDLKQLLTQLIGKVPEARREELANELGICRNKQSFIDLYKRMVENENFSDFNVPDQAEEDEIVSDDNSDDEA